MTAQVNLGNASRGARAIKVLRGTLPLTLVAEQKDVVVTDEILKAKGKKVEVVVYPKAKHAFFNDTRKEVYNPQAAQDAWKRTLDWFRANVR